MLPTLNIEGSSGNSSRNHKIGSEAIFIFFFKWRKELALFIFKPGRGHTVTIFSRNGETLAWSPMGEAWSLEAVSSPPLHLSVLHFQGFSWKQRLVKARHDMVALHELFALASQKGSYRNLEAWTVGFLEMLILWQLADAGRISCLSLYWGGNMISFSWASGEHG